MLDSPMLNMPINITCEVLPDGEQADAKAEQPEQPISAELPFQVQAEVVPVEEELYQKFYLRLEADLEEELACGCAGCHDD